MKIWFRSKKNLSDINHDKESKKRGKKILISSLVGWKSLVSITIHNKRETRGRDPWRQSRFHGIDGGSERFAPGFVATDRQIGCVGPQRKHVRLFSSQLTFCRGGLPCLSQYVSLRTCTPVSFSPLPLNSRASPLILDEDTYAHAC